MNIYVSCGKTVSIETVLPYLMAFAENSGLKSVHYTWHDGKYYNPTNSNNADMLLVYMENTQESIIGKGVYTEIESARKRNIPVLVLKKEPKKDSEIYFVQDALFDKHYKIANGTDWSKYAKLPVYEYSYDTNNFFRTRPPVFSKTIKSFLKCRLPEEMFSKTGLTKVITMQGTEMTLKQTENVLPGNSSVSSSIITDCDTEDYFLLLGR